MPITLVKNVNFGSALSGLTTVGYRLYWLDGTLSGSRVTSGVGEILTNSGIYSSSIYFSTSFSGSILWDTGGSSPTYATEEYNPQPEQIDFIRNIEGGRWKIDTSTNKMTFYKDDNTTAVATFDLKDSDGSASSTSVFERVRND
jgi:hypothetical protein